MRNQINFRSSIQYLIYSNIISKDVQRVKRARQIAGSFWFVFCSETTTENLKHPFTEKVFEQTRKRENLEFFKLDLTWENPITG